MILFQIIRDDQLDTVVRSLHVVRHGQVAEPRAFDALDVVKGDTLSPCKCWAIIGNKIAPFMDTRDFGVLELLVEKST